jgi:integrase
MGDIVRRGTKDRPRFYIRYVDVDGVRRMKLARGATTKGEAHTILAAAELRVTQGKVGIEEVEAPSPEERARASMTVRQLGERFTKEYASPRIKDIGYYRRQAATVLATRIVPHLGNRPVVSLDRSDAKRLRDTLCNVERAPDKKYAAASVKLAFATISKMINWAVEQEIVDCKNPFIGVELPTRNTSLDYLSKDEVAQLLAYAEEHAPDVHPMVATAIFTGMRKGELFGLRWCDVHLEASRIDVARSYRLAPKSGKERSVPVHPELARILRGWRDRVPRTKDGLVFPVAGHMGTRFDMLGLAELLKNAGCHVPQKPWHALRHTFASHAVMTGASLYEVQRLLGHATPAMTQIYAKLAPDHLAKTVARMSFEQPRAGVVNIDDARRSG